MNWHLALLVILLSQNLAVASTVDQKKYDQHREYQKACKPSELRPEDH